MKSIKELRTTLKFHPEEANSSISFFARNCNIDFDVFLPSLGINLQRDYVWTIEQKRELIWSVLMNRHIPRMAMLNVVQEKTETNGVYQVIDGKQRLSAMLDFYNGKYELLIDNKAYFFNELPEDYQRVIAGFMFPYYIVVEDYGTKLSDEDKINWFKYINFAGTIQDLEHLEKLNRKQP